MLHFLFTYDAVPPLKLKEYLFRGASRVTLFEMMDKAGNGIGKSTKWVAMGNLDRHGVSVITGARVTSVKNGCVHYEKDGEKLERHYDTIVVAAGSRSVKTLNDPMEALGIPYSSVGDGVRPGKLDDAIHGGFLAALTLT